MADEILGNGYLYNSKPFNVLNPSGASTGESISALTQNRQINTQANIAAADRAARSTEAEQARLLQEQQGKAELSVANRRLDLEGRHWDDEVAYRRRQEALAVTAQDHEMEMDQIRKNAAASMMEGNVSYANELLKQHDELAAKRDKISNQMIGLTTLKAAREGMFSGDMKDPTGKSVAARMYQDISDIADSKVHTFGQNRQTIIDAVHQVINLPPSVPPVDRGDVNSQLALQHYKNQDLGQSWRPVASALTTATLNKGFEGKAQEVSYAIETMLKNAESFDPQVQKQAVQDWKALKASGAVNTELLGNHLYMIQHLSENPNELSKMGIATAVAEAGPSAKLDEKTMAAIQKPSPYAHVQSVIQRLSLLADQDGSFPLSKIIRDSDVFDTVKGEKKMDPYTTTIHNIVAHLGGLSDPNQLLDALKSVGDPNAAGGINDYFKNLDPEFVSVLKKRLIESRDQMSNLAATQHLDPSLPNDFMALKALEDKTKEDENRGELDVQTRQARANAEIASKGREQGVKSQEKYKSRRDKYRSNPVSTWLNPLGDNQ